MTQRKHQAAVSKIGLVDTHSHIHDSNFFKDLDDRDSLFTEAVESGVRKVVCVGTDALTSQQAVDYSDGKQGCFAAVGLHPHDAKLAKKDMPKIEELALNSRENKVVAIGECGLDYFYENSSPKAQKDALIRHFEVAKLARLPMIFHIRGSKLNPNDAFADFWEIYDQYSPVGVVHSFSAYQRQLNDALSRGLYIGINGIITFTKDDEQLKTMLGVPLQNLVLETDSPFLTPTPFRGNVNTSKNTNLVAEFIATKNKIDISDLAASTTTNAINLFKI